MLDLDEEKMIRDLSLPGQRISLRGFRLFVGSEEEELNRRFAASCLHQYTFVTICHRGVFPPIKGNADGCRLEVYKRPDLA